MSNPRLSFVAVAVVVGTLSFGPTSAAPPPGPGESSTSPPKTKRPLVDIPLDLPDLVPQGLTFESNGAANDFSSWVKVKNSGLHESPATLLYLALWENTKGKPSTCYGGQATYQVPPLKPGETWTQAPKESWKGSGWTLAKLKACGGVWVLRADELKVVDEKSEANNVQFVQNK